MKTAKKWVLRIVSLGLVSVVTIILTVLSPGLLYAHKTDVGAFTVYHQNALSPFVAERLEHVQQQVKTSELYDADFKVSLCLDDGSVYPEIMKRLRGNAFGWGFLNYAVFKGEADYQANKISLNGYDWNLEQLFVHEVAHCMQNNALGMWNSNPMAGHPTWKWEGYAEYVARKNKDQASLVDNIDRLRRSKHEAPDAWGVFFTDETVAPRSYYEYWLLVQYCLDIKGMTYLELLESDVEKETVEQEMQSYYEESTE